jgi:transposase
MDSIALGRGDVVVGVDTHKDEHVAVVLDGLGGRLGDISIAANSDGYRRLLEWAAGLGRVHACGVEGTGSYGVGLTRFLRRHDVRVIEVSRPPRAGDHLLAGKSDTLDAEHAARQVLAGTAVSTPKLADGVVEAIRLTRIARSTAVKAHTQAIVTLKATLVTADETLRGRLEPLSDHKLILACADFDASGDPANPDVAMRHVLRSLAARYLQLHDEIKFHTKRLDALTATAAPRLVAAFGIGTDIAGELLVAAGDNTDRVRSEAAFAKLCGVSPIPTGSGRTGGRHRLNRGGNRQANAALYRAVIVRMRWHPPTIAYVERRIAEGLSKRDIIRGLKRYLARDVYTLLPTPATSSGSAYTEQRSP